MVRTSRRRFLYTAGATALSAVFLKGCLGNPPSPADLSPRAEALQLTSRTIPEITTIQIGYVPIVESAPLIIAYEKGFFDRHGMTNVVLSKQASWGSARDNVEIGSAGGGIDGGQWQMPMPYLLSEGIITKGNRKIPLVNLLQLNTQGNGIAIANLHQGQGIQTQLSESSRAYIQSLKTNGNPFKAAYTFPRVNQDFWLRYWLAANEINPNTDVNLIAVPAAQTVANMRTGTMDGFSTGDPWPFRIVKDKIGFMATLTADIWPAHPEEYFALRRDWIEKYPKATKAIVKAIMEAQIWCDRPENKEELSQILALRKYFNVPPEFLQIPFSGQYQMGDNQPDVNDLNKAISYWKDGRGSVSYPYQSHDLWFLTESVRWGFLPEAILTESDRMIKEVNGAVIWREAAQELGLPSGDIPIDPSRGNETFFDGVVFDPSNPRKYLDTLTIKSIKS